MKALQEKATPQFLPVILTLESQSEVDSLVAVLSCVGLGNALDIDYNAFKELSPFKTSHYEVVLERIVKLLK